MFPFDTMTVRQLIEELEQFEPDAKVVLVSSYGDRSCTAQALAIREVHETLPLYPSAYSDSGYKVLDNDSDPDKDEDQAPTAVVLSGVWLGH